MLRQCEPPPPPWMKPLMGKQWRRKGTTFKAGGLSPALGGGRHSLLQAEVGGREV